MAEMPMMPSLAEQVRNLSDVWQNLALHSADIAHARRTLFQAYVAEGFKEAQALELVKSI